MELSPLLLLVMYKKEITSGWVEDINDIFSAYYKLILDQDFSRATFSNIWFSDTSRSASMSQELRSDISMSNTLII